MKLFKSAREHPLMELLLKSKGNPKVLLFIEPLWGIPFHLIAPFATLYMLEQGVIDIQIGLLLTISLVSQLVFSFFGGIITDKIGRKKTTLIADIFGWATACAVWAISTNFWLFLIAIIINSSERIGATSWQCFLVEDADQKDMLGIYTWVNIAGLVAVFFAPIAGILIGRFTLVPVVRGLYGFFAVCMVIKFLITYLYCTETKRGIARMEETKSISVGKMAMEYKGLIPEMLRCKATVKIVIVNIIIHVTMMISSSFFGIYITTILDLDERLLAYFPILSAAVMLLFMFVIQHKIAHVKDKIPMWVGFVIFMICHIMLIFVPVGNLALIIAFVFFVAVASALIMPRRDAMLQIAIDPEERARIMGMIGSVTLGLAAPFGILSGFLSGIDRRLPFVLTSTLFLIAIVVVGYMKDEEYKAGASG